jgi:hypothetical protein
MNNTTLDIARKILATKGRFFSARFIKKDGSIRHITARLGVKKYLKGGQSTVRDYDNLITVFDIEKKAYRNINVDTVTMLKVNGETTVFD